MSNIANLASLVGVRNTLALWLRGLRVQSPSLTQTRKTKQNSPDGLAVRL